APRPSPAGSARDSIWAIFCGVFYPIRAGVTPHQACSASSALSAEAKSGGQRQGQHLGNFLRRFLSHPSWRHAAP
ncbi:hypothetical protein R3X43_28715, partial [Salmonella enterica subsp. enterica serovar Typhimurium]|uniref:hypothetical protein n=1 Tax=Salmonella enterica TaxID=28901 RepID=UPI002A74C4B7